MLKISASLLSADFCRLGWEIESVSSADRLHFDVMDGVFVPNISIGLPVLESVRRFTDMPIEAHLMITGPSRYVTDFARAGGDVVIFHAEAEPHEKIRDSLQALKELGKKAGLSLRPKTSPQTLLPYLDLLDQILVMTVDPGFGGQKFMEDQLQKISFLRSAIDARGAGCELAVDGGINPETALLAAEAGADVLVAGNAVFSAQDRRERIAALRAAERNQKE